MRKWVIWIAVGLFLVGCQTHAGSAIGQASSGFESDALRLTERYGDVVLLEAWADSDRKVALIVRYIEAAPSGGPLCTLFIVEQSGTGASVVETNAQFLACKNATGADLVKHALEAQVEVDTIRLEEQHVRSHSTFDFVRAASGRWHLIYGGHVGPENNPDGDELLLVSNTVAYVEPIKGPTVSEFNREAVSKNLVRSVIK